MLNESKNNLGEYSKIGQSISKVLVVEDEPLWQLLILKALRRIDDKVEISFSESANHALKILEKNKDFDAIIADQNLEGSKTGLDLYDILSEQASQTPYVLLSGTRRAEFFEDLKPFRIEALPRFIEKPSSVIELSSQLSDIFTFQANLKKHATPDSKNKFLWMMAMSAVAGSVFYSNSLSPESKNIHPLYTQYLESLHHNTVTPDVSKVFTPQVILAMNDVAMNRDIVQLANETKKNQSRNRR